jgi:hypothetical protein
MTATGLSADPKEYRRRLDEQPDERIDSWAAELMRDVSISRGVIRVLADFRKATGADDAMVERIFAAGGGPPAALGRTQSGDLMMPAITLRYLVPGTHLLMPDARERLTRYLVENFHEIVYI